MVALMVESVDTRDLKSLGRKTVRVRVPLGAQKRASRQADMSRAGCGVFGGGGLEIFSKIIKRHLPEFIPPFVSFCIINWGQIYNIILNRL